MKQQYIGQFVSNECHECRWCCRHFRHMSSLSRHKRTCDARPQFGHVPITPANTTKKTTDGTTIHVTINNYGNEAQQHPVDVQQVIGNLLVTGSRNASESNEGDNASSPSENNEGGNNAHGRSAHESNASGNNAGERHARSRHKGLSTAKRNALWNRDFGELVGVGSCACCGKVISQQNFHAGHVVARACGGSDNLSNLVPLCSSCNVSMGSMNFHEFAKDFK